MGFNVLKEKVIIGAELSDASAPLKGQYSIPNIVYDAYIKTKEGQEVLRQILYTIQSDGELNKIASEDPINPGGYAQKTAADFWSQFNNINPTLYEQLKTDFKEAFPLILKFKITKVATYADPDQFEELDITKNKEVFGNREMPSFQQFMQNKASATGATPLKQTSIA